MKKILTLASAAALAAVSVSAGAWWGVPCIPQGLTQDQQQAMAQQQTKAMERLMAAQRQRAEQMAAQQAQAAERMKTQGIDLRTMGFPAAMAPRNDRGPWKDPWNTANSWDMSGPKYPTMPAMPTMPEPFPMDGSQPSVPAFMQDRYAELEAYRARILEESKARRDKMTREMTERRRQLEANRPTHRPYRPTRSFTSPRTGMTTGTTRPPERFNARLQTPPVVTPAPVAKAATTTDRATAPVAPKPASGTAPVTPVEKTTKP